MSLTHATHAIPRNLQGALLVVAGMVILGFSDNFVRLVSDRSSVWQFHAIRGLMVIPMIVIAARLTGGGLRVRDRRRVAMRTALLVTSMMLYFASLPLMPIAAAAAGLFTSPLWILIITVVVFREKVGPRRVGAVIVGVVGAALILDVFSAEVSLTVLMPVSAGAFYAVSQIMTRRYCAAESTWAMLLYTYIGFVIAGALGAVAMAGWTAPPALQAAAPFIFGDWGPVTLFLLAMMVFFAVASVVSIGMLIRAYQIGDPTFLTMFDYAFLISAAVTAHFVWEEAISPRMALGGALIIVAGAYLSIRSGAKGGPGRKVV